MKYPHFVCVLFVHFKNSWTKQALRTQTLYSKIEYQDLGITSVPLILDCTVTRWKATDTVDKRYLLLL